MGGGAIKNFKINLHEAIVINANIIFFLKFSNFVISPCEIHLQEKFRQKMFWRKNVRSKISIFQSNISDQFSILKNEFY